MSVTCVAVRVGRKSTGCRAYSYLSQLIKAERAFMHHDPELVLGEHLIAGPYLHPAIA